MKYIKQHIKKICPSVEIKPSLSGSQSEYFILNSYLKIRLSDHVSPFCGGCDLDVVTMIEDTTKFIVFYKDSRIPLCRNRNDINKLISSLYEYTKYRQIAKDRNEEAESRIIKSYDTSDEAKTIFAKMVEENSSAEHLDSTNFVALMGKCGGGEYLSHFTPRVKALLREQYDRGIKGIDFIQFIIDNKKIHHASNENKNIILKNANKLLKIFAKKKTE